MRLGAPTTQPPENALVNQRGVRTTCEMSARCSTHKFRFLIPCVIASLLHGTPDAAASEPVRYQIAFPNADHHEAEVTVEFSGIKSRILETRMSRTSPGRYALHEFSKNVYHLRASDGHGRLLPTARPDPHQWNIAEHDGTVRIQYTVFGDRTDGTYLGINNTHAHINVPATFLWARGLEDRPIELAVETGEKQWSVATQLPAGDRPGVFTAPDLGFFLDSPLEIGPFQWREWNLDSPTGPLTFRLAAHHGGDARETDAFWRMCQAVLPEAIAVFGEPPRYDFGTYTFIADYLPHATSDGMEHRNSTVLTSPEPLAGHAVSHLYTVAHEFFHAWNVERLRPKSLEPFRLEETNLSGDLWFSEGFTSYYHSLLLRRARIISLDRYTSDLVSILNDVVSSPGHEFAGPEEMSLQAPFRDAARSVDPTNERNTFISYYPYGAAIALALDLTLRAEFPGVSLDSFMREAWTRHGKPEVPFVQENLQKILGDITGDTGWAADFFNRHIRGHELPPFRELLARAGLELRPIDASAAWIGSASMRFEENKAVLSSGTRMGSPLYAAGLDRNDILLTLDGSEISSQESLNNVMASHRAGDTVPVRFEKTGEERNVTLTFQADPELELVRFEKLDRTETPEMKGLRTEWLGGHATPVSQMERFCPTCRRGFPFEFEFCNFDGAGLEIVKPD